MPVKKATNPSDRRRITVLPVDALVPYEKNARTHSEAQIAQIAASIREFGWTNPILIDEADGIVAGHGRVLAARLLEERVVPCIVLTGLTDLQRQAYMLADNKIALNAGWDDTLLREALLSLQENAVDLSLLGFSGADLAAALATTRGNTDPDDAPPVPEVPTSALGDVWLLGNHRIVCGDSTTIEAVDRCLNGAVPHLMVTDPPYGVEYDPVWRDGTVDEATGKRTGRDRLGPLSGRAKGQVLNDDRADWREAWALFPGEVAYVWHADSVSPVVAESLTVNGLELRNLIVWAKDRLVIGRGHYHHQYEPCWYAVRKGGTGHWNGDRKQTTLWSIPKPQKSETGHGTQKPIECMKRPIENNSKPGDHVYEPFSGSGTTIIACEQTGRVCHAIELSPAYVDVAVKRWQAFAGKAATLAGDGRTFAEIAVSRLSESAQHPV